jgi:hypothetical protein
MSTPTNIGIPTSKINVGEKFYKGLGGILAATGIIIYVIFLILQVITINNGSTSQSVIDAEMIKVGWGFGTAAVLVILGAGFYYYYYNTSERPLILLFVLTMFSYLLSNIAILCSVYQVTVK